MRTADWRKAEAAFHDIADAPPAERAAKLAALPLELRVVVEQLLTEAGGDDAIHRAIQGAATLAAQPAAFAGPYRLIRQIGEGGMGAVYLAARADDTFDKLVAVKFVRRGMETPLLRQRFDAERRILARLEHPAIARLLDAGETPDGLPYLVLEYVEGRTIVEHAVQAGLNLRRRLEVFLRVCGAVEYAHRNLVVHRDLKPSNVLIDAASMPKLLDFGIAKLLDGPGSQSSAATALRLLTPDYASPEQIRGEAVGVGADVYSLGAVLYELLAESRPYRLEGLSVAEAERTVTAGRMERPSARSPKLRRQLEGDLDNIVLKAMRIEPAERYGSVAELAADLQRHLEGRPVLARDYQLWERAWKFARRHRTAVAAACLVSASLVAGTAAAERAARRAEAARQIAVAERARAEAEASRAERERAEAARQAALAQRLQTEAEKRYDDEQSVLAKLMDDLYNMGSLEGSTAVRRNMLEVAIPHLEQLARDPRASAEVRFNLAEAYQGLGFLLGSLTATGTGDRQKGMDLLLRSLAAYQTLVREQPRKGEFVAQLAETNGAIGELVAQSAKDPREALPYLDNSVRQARRALQLLPKRGDVWDIAMRMHINRLQNTMARDVAAASLGDIAEFDRLAAQAPAYPGLRRNTAFMRSLEGQLFVRRGEPAKSVRPFQEALAAREKLWEEDPRNAETARAVSVTHSHLADTYRDLDGPGSPRVAREYEQVVAIQGRLAADPNDRTAQFSYGAGLTGLAEVRMYAGDLAAALEPAELGLAQLRKVVPANEPSIRRQTYLSRAYRVAGEIQHRAGRNEDAVKTWRAALELSDLLLKQFDKEPAILDDAAGAAIGLALYGPAGERVAMARRALGLAERAADAPQAQAPHRDYLARIRGDAALVLAASGQTVEARQLATRSLAGLPGMSKTIRDAWPEEALAKVRALAAN